VQIGTQFVGHKIVEISRESGRNLKSYYCKKIIEEELSKFESRFSISIPDIHYLHLFFRSMIFYTLMQTNSKTPKFPLFSDLVSRWRVSALWTHLLLSLFNLLFCSLEAMPLRLKSPFSYPMGMAFFHEPCYVWWQKKWLKVEDKDWEMGSQHKARAKPRTLMNFNDCDFVWEV
jgi:hypothetical protein